MTRSLLYCICLAIALVQPFAAAAQSDWLAEPSVQVRLGAGEVVVQTATATDPARPQGWVRAAVRIRAPAERIWSVITDCKQTVAFVPGLKRCRRVGHATDGQWEDIEHEVRYSWFLPSIRYVFRAEYHRPDRIDFHRVSGDVKEEQGTWLLMQTPDAATTTVQYEMYLDPGFWVPQTLVARSLRRDLPAALTGLKERVERSAADTGRGAPPPAP
jgi:hypothetical protein